ncbi:MAG: PQQ-dependent sugar dehydrogenase [Methylotetracoccus sp.]|nr:PQQ-dependent sugar dehydrogenase [Methylotetracoccus sp.]
MQNVAADPDRSSMKSPLMRYVFFFSILFASFSVIADTDALLKQIKLPRGFAITLYADQVPGARGMALGDDGTVYLGTINEGKVFALRDRNGDGYAEQVVTVASGLNMPNGVAFYRNDLYIAEISRIVKLKEIGDRLDQPPPPEVVADVYPNERVHAWKLLKVGPDAKLYAAVGAPCNICLSDDPIFATLTRIDLDGKNLEVYARGIRNTVGFDWHPDTGDLYFADNGADWLGEDLPADELNRASGPGLHFGYPYCHAGDLADANYGQQKSCDQFTAPVWKFPAHVAALGIRFYRGRLFPPDYRGQLFVAQHGSWNRKQSVGYRVVVVRFNEGRPTAEDVFAEGWLQADGKEWGRPVDILELADGSLLVSDDLRGVVYRITYRPA